MNMQKSTLLLAVLFLFALAIDATAQSTLMNVPSTDVVSPRKVYLEMDFITNYAWERNDHFENYIPRTVIGVGKNVEVGANLSYTHVPGGGEPIELQPNAKWQFYNNEQKGIAAALGCIGYIPITHRSGTRTIAQCYGVAEARDVFALFQNQERRCAHFERGRVHHRLFGRYREGASTYQDHE